MYSLKVIKDNERELRRQELDIERTRQFMTLFANANKGKHQTPFTPQDFWRLSYDKTVVEEKPMSLKEIKELLGSKIRKADGGK